MIGVYMALSLSPSSALSLSPIVAPTGLNPLAHRHRTFFERARRITLKEEAAQPQKPTVELCMVNDDFEIEECEVMMREDLPKVLGFAQAAKVMNDPMSANVVFGKRVADETANSKEGSKVGEVFTLADWQVCLDEDECEIPNDVLLKGLGPDASDLLREKKGEGDAKDSTTAQQKKYFHLHFGAGRLGMGLVVPAISASGVPFAVVQRPKRRWMELFNTEGQLTGEDELGVSVNSDIVVHNVEVIKSDEGKPDFLPPHSLIFGSTPEELGVFVERATSFSCSIGSAMETALAPLLEILPVVEREEQPTLFCCENDHDAVARLKERLAGKVFVVDCMVDRVCTGRTITTEGIDVSAEPWRGSIVVLDPDVTGRLPFCPSVATVPRSNREAEYLSERKFTLVNGMHTVVAFMTLLAEFVDDDSSSREYVLRKYTQMPRDSQRMCEAWRTARAAQLLEKYGVDSLMEWHAVDTREAAWGVLLEYADEVLEERFSKSDDVVSRVLGGGVANRWLTRLRPTDTWMAEQLRGASSQGEQRGGGGSEIEDFVAYAVVRDRERAIERGCSLEDAEWRGCEIEAELDADSEPMSMIASYLSSLTRTSQRFCKREVQITHKQLVKEQRKAGGRAQAPRVQDAMERQKGRGI